MAKKKVVKKKATKKKKKVVKKKAVKKTVKDVMDSQQRREEKSRNIVAKMSVKDLLNKVPLLRKPSETRNAEAVTVPEDVYAKLAMPAGALMYRLSRGLPVPPLAIETVSELGLQLAEKMKLGCEWDRMRLLINIAHSSKPVAEVAVMQAERLCHPTEKEVGTVIDRSGKIVTDRAQITLLTKAAYQ